MVGADDSTILWRQFHRDYFIVHFPILKINSTIDWQQKCVIYYTTIRTADLLKQPIDPSSHIGSSLSPRDISFIEIRFILLEN